MHIDPSFVELNGNPRRDQHYPPVLTPNACTSSDCARRVALTPLMVAPILTSSLDSVSQSNGGRKPPTLRYFLYICVDSGAAGRFCLRGGSAGSERHQCLSSAKCRALWADEQSGELRACSLAEVQLNQTGRSYCNSVLNTRTHSPDPPPHRGARALEVRAVVNALEVSYEQNTAFVLCLSTRTSHIISYQSYLGCDKAWRFTGASPGVASGEGSGLRIRIIGDGSRRHRAYRVQASGGGPEGGALVPFRLGPISPTFRPSLVATVVALAS